MDIDVLSEDLKRLQDRKEKLFDICKVSEKRKTLEQLQKKTYDDNFYTNNEEMASILSNIRVLSDKLKKFDEVNEKLEDAKVYLEIASSDNDLDSYKEAVSIVSWLDENTQKLEVESLLCDKYDSNNSIVSIHPRCRWCRVSRLG